MKLRIAFIDATAAGKGKRQFTRDAIGCGVRSICGILEQNKIDVHVFLAENILKQGFPDGYTTLFVSGMSMDKVAIRKVISLWRKKHSGKVVVGGPITSELESSLVSTKADVIVIGEGEITIQELLDSNYLISGNPLVLETINGIGYFDSQSKAHINAFRKYSTREQFQSFLPSTQRIRDYRNYFSAKVYVEITRGCSNFNGTRIELPDGRKCSECGACESKDLEDRVNCPEGIPPGCGFCSVPSLYGPPRSRPADLIVKEIKQLAKLGVKRIILSAPDFLDYERDANIKSSFLISTRRPIANVSKIEELLAKITQIQQFQDGKLWVEIENVKASLFTEEIAKIISRYIPNSSFSIGCETGSEKHSILLGRPSSPNETLRAVKIASRYGLRVHVYFIHSLPGQTKETALETAKLIRKIARYIEKVTIYRFSPLPLSAFGDFPEPKPAIKNPISKIISDAANEVNLTKKRKYLDEIVKVIISEANFRDETGTIAYMIGGGPMVAVVHSRDMIGNIVDVKITKVLSDKLLLGTIISKK